MEASSHSGFGATTAQVMRWIAAAIRGEFIKRAGGPIRARIIVLFALTLGLNGADAATVGAIAPQLEASLHIGNTRVGLLTSVALIMGAVATIPVGMLVDRIRRMPVLSLSIILWSAASLLGPLRPTTTIS